jgi:REP element-mobilizing transposase RayT
MLWPGETVYLNDEDYAKFLAILEKVIKDFQWICHANCLLLTNHCHLLIETLQMTLSSGMRQLNGLYSRSFSGNHAWIGYTFQGRFKALIIEKGQYLLELCQYVVLNPVGAKIVAVPREWKRSSYGGSRGRIGNYSFSTGIGFWDGSTRIDRMLAEPICGLSLRGLGRSFPGGMYMDGFWWG